EERLLAYLFSDYDPVARALEDDDGPVIVSIDFVILRIHGLDERSQVLTTTAGYLQEWMDQRLTWHPEDFGNLTNIIVKAEQLWLPELAVMNGADELMPDFERIRVLLRHNGQLHWEPGGIFKTTCDIDITYFPFDRQMCPLLIGAYSYVSNKMNITNASNKIHTHDFRRNGEWHVFHTTAKWDITFLQCCPGTGYSHVVFALYLERRFKFYIMNIVLPCLMLSVLIMIGFCLPPDAGEKISLGISVLLAFTVFLLMIADNIPRTSLAIPLMVNYLMATMSLGTVSICMTVCVLNVHHHDPEQKVPKWLHKVLLIWCARLVCVRTSARKTMTERVYAKKAKRRWKGCALDSNGVCDDTELIRLTMSNMHAQINSQPSAQTVRIQCNGPNKAEVKPAMPSVRDQNNMAQLRRSIRNKLASSSSQNTVEAEADYSKDWREVAIVLDRLFFWLLFILMTSSTVFILLYPQYGDVKEPIGL
ncbi:hypothetical protein CAPTEDRAFT_104243, partial [Capitella teleta]